MNIIIYAICKNEAQFAERFMGSCAEADGVYVLDTGSTGSAATWWLRSPRRSNSTAFVRVYNSGVAGTSNASISYGVAPGFCV